MSGVDAVALTWANSRSGNLAQLDQYPARALGMDESNQLAVRARTGVSLISETPMLLRNSKVLAMSSTWKQTWCIPGPFDSMNFAHRRVRDRGLQKLYVCRAYGEKGGRDLLFFDNLAPADLKPEAFAPKNARTPRWP